jgi:acyl-CoA thioesterase
MDAKTFFGLERDGESPTWRMEVVRSLTSGTGALFGGVGLGACIEVMEQLTGRPCVWATAQFLSYAEPPAVVQFDAVEVVRGHKISQARVIAHAKSPDGRDTEILTVLGALGHRPLDLEGQWAVMPDVPGPLESPPRVMLNHHEGRISSRLDAKLARGRSPFELDGHPLGENAALWVRVPEMLDMSAAALAIIGDFVPFGIGQALGKRAGGNSLDNTLRVAHRVPTEWVLADVRVSAIADGFGHGLVHLWSLDGTLLGTASQSTIVRAWREDPDHALTELEGEVKP